MQLFDSFTPISQSRVGERIAVLEDTRLGRRVPASGALRGIVILTLSRRGKGRRGQGKGRRGRGGRREDRGGGDKAGWSAWRVSELTPQTPGLSGMRRKV